MAAIISEGINDCVRDIVERYNNIDILVNSFRKNAQETETIIQLCKQNNINI